ncbi:MAG: cytidine deaminase [Spirochaetes bacterium]|nr:cytidine deaminase [Spirochaetota bacterium]
MKISKDAIAALREHALRAAASAYAPYSGIHVGAAILASDGNIYTGCNVENGSYGLTVCAERNAIATAVRAITGDRASLIRAIYIESPNASAGKKPVLKMIPPCGACRQVISEFGKGGLVFFPATKGIKKLKVADLLPEAFQL